MSPAGSHMKRQDIREYTRTRLSFACGHHRYYYMFAYPWFPPLDTDYSDPDAWTGCWCGQCARRRTKDVEAYERARHVLTVEVEVLKPMDLSHWNGAVHPRRKAHGALAARD